MMSRLAASLVLSVATITAAPVERELLGDWRLTAPDELQHGIVEWRVTLTTGDKFRFETQYSADRTRSETGRWHIRGSQLELNFQDPDEDAPRRPELVFDIFSVGRDRLLACYGPWDVTFARIK